MKKKVRVFYSGVVQGVGFRYTVRHLAAGAGVGGWVRNLEDGRVELVAEGEEESLQKLLKDIETGPLGHYIRHADIDWKPAGEAFKNFDIRF